jgi:predicted NAD/FAD-dependent oxidoreductase
MTAVAKHLAKDMDIQLNTRIETISLDGEVWSAKDVDGKVFRGNHLILTAPVPQSLALFTTGKTDLPEEELVQLKSIQYYPCIALLALLDGLSNIPSPGGIKFRSGLIQWIADNTQKGISPDVTAITVHASPQFSAENYNLEKEQLAAKLLDAAKPWLPGKTTDWQIHKWRFSQPLQQIDTPFVRIGELPSLYFAGDALGSARVEGAALSGMAAGDDLHNYLSGR